MAKPGYASEYLTDIFSEYPRRQGASDGAWTSTVDSMTNPPWFSETWFSVVAPMPRQRQRAPVLLDKHGAFFHHSLPKVKVLLRANMSRRVASDGAIDPSQLEHVPPEPLDHVTNALSRNGPVIDGLSQKIPIVRRGPVLAVRQISASHGDVQPSHDGRGRAPR